MRDLTAWWIGRLASHRRDRPVGVAVVGAAVTASVPLTEISLADLGHPVHLLLMLVAVMVASIAFGIRAGLAALLLGAFGCAAGAVINDEVSDAGAIGAIVLYLVTGGAYLVVLDVALQGQRRRATLSPRLVLPLVEQPTARELDVLRLAAAGMSLPEIAERLFLSPNTVKTHLSHVYGKLGATNRQDAIRAAIHHGCLDFSDLCPHRAAPVKPTSV